MTATFLGLASHARLADDVERETRRIRDRLPDPVEAEAALGRVRELQRSTVLSTLQAFARVNAEITARTLWL